MDCLPWSTFARLVAHHHGDQDVRTFPCTEQYRAMAFAQLTYRESLRDIEACLSAQPTKLWHMGFRGSVRRSTLADANEARDWRIYGNSQAPPRVSPIGNNGFLFSRPRLKLIACGAGT
jgi:hypothetical protein